MYPSNSKLVGKAIVGIRAHIHELEMRLSGGNNQRYRYQIDRNQGEAWVIHVSTQTEYDRRSLAEWAVLGTSVRLAFIGLKFEKRRLIEELRAKMELPNIRFELLAISGTACLTRNGEPLQGLPSTIEEWARIGRSVEQPLFEKLKATQEQLVLAREKLRAAVDWQSESGILEGRAEVAQLERQITALRDEGIYLGVFREPRSKE